MNTSKVFIIDFKISNIKVTNKILANYLINVGLIFEKFLETLFSFSLTAPGSYEVEKAEKTIHQSSSAYSFGSKYKEQKIEDIPGKL